MSTVRAILEQRRLPLLDLSSRSAFLNYNADPAFGLELINVKPLHLYASLFSERQAFTLRSISQKNETPEAAPPVRPIQHRQLQTPYAVSQLQKRLVQTRYHAQARADDSGESSLFLTLGKLRWVVPGEAEQVYQAPLVFVPVLLKRQDVRSPFVLEATGADPHCNQVLRAFLQREHNLSLPDFNPFQSNGLKGFLDAVSVAIEKKQGWHVGRQVSHVDFFERSNFDLYEDLDPEKGFIGVAEDVELIRKVLRDGFIEDEPQPVDQLSIDMLAEPDQLDHVLDANNEQLLVLYDTLRGVNQVIEAPAGSGKTQTIANLVSAVLGAEKTVLVVSNKVRALDDLQTRLGTVGLAPLVLPLYGTHLDRRSIASRIHTALSFQAPAEVDEKQHVESLRRLRDQLNVYCKSLHMPIRDSGVTPYEAYNELVEIEAQLEGVSRPEFDGKVLADWTASRFEAVLQRTRELETHFSRIGVPQRHPFWGSKKSIFKAADRPEVQRKCRLAGMALNALRVAATELAHQMGAPAPNHSEDVIRLVRAASKAIEAPDVRGINVQDAQWNASMEELVSVIETGSKLKKVRASQQEVLIPEAWDQDVLSVRQAFVAHGEKKTRKLIKEYRKARDRLAGLCRNGLPESNAAQLEAVNAILESQRLYNKLSQHSDLAKALFGQQWKGIGSNWEHLDKVSAWLYELHQEIAQGEVSSDILHALGSDLDLTVVHDLAKKAAGEFNTFLQTSRDAAREVAMEDALGITKRAFGRIPFGTLLSLFAHWEKNIDSLQDIVAFNHLAQRLREEGLGDIVHLAVTWSEASKHLTTRIREARYLALLTDALNSRRTLAGFDGEVHSQFVEKYEEFDTTYLRITSGRIQQVQKQRLLRERLPAGNLLTALHELEEAPAKRRESIFSGVAREVVDVMPVFLMTPSSVAQLLRESDVVFDLIVFDEAGRIGAAEALGSLARGSQVVAFGDSQQALMPRPYAARAGEEEVAGQASESILDLLKQQQIPCRELTWIYGSRPVPLMEWINQTVYGNRLHVIPSSDAQNAWNTLGIHEVLEPGSTAQNGLVRSFVGSVVEAILKHAEHVPGKSIGIIVQTAAEVGPILRELERRRQRDPSFEAFFKAHANEPFYVKTIDMAQGDLRDVIFFAMAFKKVGRTLNGKMGATDEEMRRQLAVLSSVARQECHLFTDTAVQDVLRFDQRTVNPVLSRFLHHVKQSFVDVEQPIIASKFEVVIANALRQEGYRVALGVGSSGFRVNVAVLDDQRRGAYVLGILCDGEQYASVYSARERDRLIPTLLASQGWSLHRVWSVEWYRNPERELARLLEHLQDLSRRVKGPSSGSTINVTSNGTYRSMEEDAHEAG